MDSGEAKKSNSQLSFSIGYGRVLDLYVHFIYGSQIMQSVLDEKTSRIVEVIVSSVRPFNDDGESAWGWCCWFYTIADLVCLIGTLSTAGLLHGRWWKRSRYTSHFPIDASEAAE